MTLPEPFTVERTARLGGTAPPVEPVEPPPLPPATPRRPLPRRVAARAVHSRAGRSAAAVARRAARRLLAADLAGTRDAVETQAVQVEELRRVVAATVGSQVEAVQLSARTQANSVNLELLKAEVRALERTLQELGMAFAPATGLAGAGVRFAELREQVNAVSRRLRLIDRADAVAPPRSSSPADDAPQPAVEAPTESDGFAELFDYVAFERRFRGDPEEILRIQSERYLDLLSSHPPVVDVGCGRGELAEVLAQHGVEVIGVEPDRGMAAEARARGVDVRTTDAVAFLESCDDDSLGAVFSAHVAEHVPFDVLLHMVHLALRKLKPGGLFVAETPNPAALIVLGNSFILDPTHLRPVHPSLFAFICENAGFRDVRLDFHAPASSYHIRPIGPSVEGFVALDEDMQRLNSAVFGPQEYVIVATKAPAGDG